MINMAKIIYNIFDCSQFTSEKKGLQIGQAHLNLLFLSFANSVFLILSGGFTGCFIALKCLLTHG